MTEMATTGMGAGPMGLVRRPEIVRQVGDADKVEVASTLSWPERLYEVGLVRKAAVLLGIAILWQAYGTWLDNPLLFPSFRDTVEAFWAGMTSGVIPARASVSIQTLLMGYGLGIVGAALLTTVAIGSRIGTDLLETLTSMFNPLPAIACCRWR